MRITIYIYFNCMYKKVNPWLILVVAIIGCQTSKQLPYFKDLPDTAPVSKISTTSYEPLRLQANDQVQVTVSSISPEASQFFNLVAVSQPISGGASSFTAAPQSSINAYHVASTGSITVPVLGNITAGGLTT